MNLQEAIVYWIPWLGEVECLLGQQRIDDFEDAVIEKTLDYAKYHRQFSTYMPGQGVRRKRRAFEEDDPNETPVDVPSVDDDAASAESRDSVGLDGDSGTGTDHPD
jgi:hypothetical protein